MGMGAGQPGGQQPAAGGKGQAPQGGQPPAAGGKGQAPQGGQQPGMGGKGQPGGQGGQQVNLPGYAQPYYQNLIARQQQPGMGGNGQPGGQQLQVRSQPEVFNSPFSPQQREQYLQSENLANYPPIPQVQQPYGGFRQQPGMGGQQGQQAPSPQQMELIKINPMAQQGPQQGPQQSQAYNDFLQQSGLSPQMIQQIQQAQQIQQMQKAIPNIQQQLYGMGGQQPQVSLPLPYGGFGQQPGMGGQQPPQPPQMSQQDYNQQMKNFAMQRDQARRQGLDEHSIQRQQLDLVRNYAAQRGPQPSNPLAQPQQLRPEDPRMMAMRYLQQMNGASQIAPNQTRFDPSQMSQQQLQSIAQQRARFEAMTPEQRAQFQMAQR